MKESSNLENPEARSFFLTGGKIAVVIIHGYGGSIGDYRMIGHQLQSSGYTVSGIRLAGHGLDMDSLRRTNVNAMRTTVSTEVKRLIQSGYQIVLLGSSFGGVLALDYALNYPDDLIALATVNIALSYRGWGNLQGLILRILKMFTPDYPKKGLNPAEQEYAIKIGSALAWPISGILETSKFAKQLKPQVINLKIPYLIMQSQIDNIVKLSDGRKIFSSLPLSSKWLVTIPVNTHRPFRDPTANRFMADRINEMIHRCFRYGHLAVFQ